jgi:hypothetical protein
MQSVNPSTPVDIRTKLSTLWIFVMFNMVFADIIGLIEPGTLEAMLAGDFGFEITPALVVVISLVQAIPIGMIVVSRLMNNPRVNRWANIGAGVLTLLYITGGGSWDKTSYIVFASIEIVGLLAIIWAAWKWSAPTLANAVFSPAESI